MKKLNTPGMQQQNEHTDTLVHEDRIDTFTVQTRLQYIH